MDYVHKMCERIKLHVRSLLISNWQYELLRIVSYCMANRKCESYFYTNILQAIFFTIRYYPVSMLLLLCVCAFLSFLLFLSSVLKYARCPNDHADNKKFCCRLLKWYCPFLCILLILVNSFVFRCCLFVFFSSLSLLFPFIISILFCYLFEWESFSFWSCIPWVSDVEHNVNNILFLFVATFFAFFIWAVDNTKKKNKYLYAVILLILLVFIRTVCVLEFLLSYFTFYSIIAFARFNCVVCCEWEMKTLCFFLFSKKKNYIHHKQYRIRILANLVKHSKFIRDCVVLKSQWIYTTLEALTSTFFWLFLLKEIHDKMINSKLCQMFSMQFSLPQSFYWVFEKITIFFRFLYANLK